MSGVLRPVGREGSGTYWRRRAVFGVALIAVLMLAWFVGSAAFGSDGQAQQAGANPAAPTANPSTGPATVTQTPSPTNADSGSATQGPTPTAAQGSGPPAPESATPAVSAPAPASARATPPGSDGTESPAPAAPACAPGDVRVSVDPAHGAIAAGEPLVLVMKVTNVGRSACSRDVGTAVNELRVTSGRALVWSSTFCAEKGIHRVVELAPGGSWSGKGRWPGRITVPGCPADQPPATAGTYRAQARNGNLQSQPERFLVK